LAVTVKLVNTEEITEFFSIPEPRGLVKSNLWAFKQKYGSYPSEGISVMAKIDDSGFFRIVY